MRGQHTLSAGATGTGSEVRQVAGKCNRRFRRRLEGIDYGPLEHYVGYAVKQARTIIYEDFERTVNMAGISPQRYAALVIISLNPGINQNRLGEVLGTARSGATIFVRALISAGLVSRFRKGSDQRAYALKIALKGEEILKQLNCLVAEHDRTITRNLTISEQRELVELLGKIEQGEGQPCVRH